MHRTPCLMHANCQGEELERLLLASSSFNNKYRLVRRTNYAREPISQEELAECGLFMYQHLGEEWGEFASAALLRRLPPSALPLCIPNLFFKGCWPFWASRGPIDFSDTLLNRLIDEGAPKPVILRVYLHGNIRSFVDLQAVLEESIEIERKKEAQTCVKTVDFFLKNWKQRPFFHTINHPGKELLIHAANGILSATGFSPLRDDEIAVACAADFPSYSDFDLPVHPQVATFHGLDFAGPTDSFAVFGRRMTFAEYISRYIDCRINGMEKDFLGYLQLV